MQTPNGGAGAGRPTEQQLDHAAPLSQQETTRIAHEQVASEAEAPVHSFQPHSSPTAKRAQAERAIPADLLPDFRNLGNKRGGLHTELGTNDVNQIRQALTAAQRKPIAPVKRHILDKVVLQHLVHLLVHLVLQQQQQQQQRLHHVYQNGIE